MSLTVEDLITELERLPQDAKVFVYADHGQNYEGLTSVEAHTDLAVGLQEEEVDGISVALYGW